MLIDWVTARSEMTNFPPENWEALRNLADRVVRYCPRTGEVVWESCAWDSVRSDTHQIAFRVGADGVAIQGSPARVIGTGDAVFGEGASANLDLVGCVTRMANFVSGLVGVPFPTNPEAWKVSRVDITGNIELDDLPAVRIALRILRECEGGRYRVSQQAGDTVYWSHRSRLRSGKAYAKGPHLRQATVKPEYTGRAYSEAELCRADRLLRLELKLGAQWWRRKAGEDGCEPWTVRTAHIRKHNVTKWFQVTAEDLRNEWLDYFERMIGGAEMNTGTNIKDRIHAAAKTPGQGAAAYACWLMIEKDGWQGARELFSKNGKPTQTWYRHMKVFHAAGLSDADISTGNVVPLRRKVLEYRIVDTWADLMKVA